MSVAWPVEGVPAGHPLKPFARDAVWDAPFVAYELGVEIVGPPLYLACGLTAEQVRKEFPEIHKAHQMSGWPARYVVGVWPVRPITLGEK